MIHRLDRTSLLVKLFFILFFFSQSAIPVENQPINDPAESTASGQEPASPSGYTSKDFMHWLQMAYIAQAIYQDQAALEKALKPLGYHIEQADKLAGYSVDYVLATNDLTKQQLIVVRGTSNAENVIVDAAFVLVKDDITGVNLHQGFRVSARDIVEAVKPKLKQGYTVNTVGHSLGGAAALIVAMMLDASGYHIGEVVTFGQPKVTDIPGTRHFQHLNVTRIVTPKDVVPLVPPFDPSNLMNLGVFYHMGKEILLYPDQRYSVLEGMDSMLRAASYLDDIPQQENISNHFMTTYITLLENKQSDPHEVPYKQNFRIPGW